MNDFIKKFRIDELTIYENTHWTWSLRPHHPVLGSSILSIKRKALTLSDLTIEEFKKLGEITIILEKTLKDTFNYDVINYLALMMFDKIVHFHIFPRYKNSRFLNGQKWEDEMWPSIPNLLGVELFPDKAQEIIKAIKNNINLGEKANEEI